jgi:thioredoxin-like negative regulator of GroEL
VSDEPEGLIEDVFIATCGAKYPFVKGKNCNGKYGVTGFPTFVLIDADGLVAQVGMPSEPQIEKLLEDALVAPKLPDDARYEPLRVLWQKGEFVKVREHLDKQLATPALDAATKDVLTAHREAFEKRMAAAAARVAKLGAGPDYAAAEQQLEKIERQWRGLPPAEAATKELARFAADAVIKKELAAGKALEKLLASLDPAKPSQRKKLIEALDQFGKKHAGTFAGRQADEQRVGLTRTR